MGMGVWDQWVMIDNGGTDSPDGAEQVVLGEGWAAGDRLCVLGYSLC